MRVPKKRCIFATSNKEVNGVAPHQSIPKQKTQKMGSGFTRAYKGESFIVTDGRTPNEIFMDEKKPSKKFCVTYYRLDYDKGNRLTTSYGSPMFEHYDNGLRGYEQCDSFETLDEALDFVRVKKQVVSNWYRGFGILKFTKNGCETISPNEWVNKVVVKKHSC